MRVAGWSGARLVRAGLLLAMGTLLLCGTGCATNRKYNYNDSGLTLPAAGHSVAVAANDRRPEVLKGDEKPDYVGSQRGGYGNPWKVKTKGEVPLAGVFADAIANALSRPGTKASAVKVSLGSDNTAALQQLKSSGAERLVLLTIEQWDSDTYVNTDLDYALRLQVFDGQGTPLAASQLKGKDTLKNGFLDPAGDAEGQAPAAFRERMEKLFADPSIQAAMK